MIIRTGFKIISLLILVVVFASCGMLVPGSDEGQVRISASSAGREVVGESQESTVRLYLFRSGTISVEERSEDAVVYRGGSNPFEIRGNEYVEFTVDFGERDEQKVEIERIPSGTGYKLLLEIVDSKADGRFDGAVSRPFAIRPGQVANVELEIGVVEPYTPTPAIEQIAVYAGDGSGEVHAIGHDGSTVWVNDEHENTIYEIDVDAQGNIYTASSDNYAKKINSEGETVWSIEHENMVGAVAVDIPRGYVYTASDLNPIELRKYTIDGELVWSHTVSSGFSMANGLEVDEDGYIYLGASTSDRVVKIDPDAPTADPAIIWSTYLDSYTLNSVSLDDEFVYAGNYNLQGNNGVVTKLNRATGAKVWWNTVLRVQEVFADGLGNVYAVESSTDNPPETQIHKFDAAGDVVWRYDYPNSMYTVAVNRDTGDIYFTPWASRVYRLDADRNEIWTYEQPSGSVRALAFPVVQVGD